MLCLFLYSFDLHTHIICLTHIHIMITGQIITKLKPIFVFFAAPSSAILIVKTLGAFFAVFCRRVCDTLRQNGGLQIIYFYIFDAGFFKYSIVFCRIFDNKQQLLHLLLNRNINKFQICGTLIFINLYLRVVFFTFLNRLFSIFTAFAVTTSEIDDVNDEDYDYTELNTTTNGTSNRQSDKSQKKY